MPPCPWTTIRRDCRQRRILLELCPVSGGCDEERNEGRMMVSSPNNDPSDALTHIGARGEARMVDVSEKDATSRVAVAEGHVRMGRGTLKAILAGDAKKGDVIGAARIAGIMAAKKTAELIPLCHPLQLSKIAVDIAPDESMPGLKVRAEARCFGPTGVEMEALTAVSVACLTIYDMAKAIDRGMSVEGVRLVEKRGGKSGEWRAEDRDA
jgi:cyclic pyranopterin monophosphate synthase